MAVYTPVTLAQLQTLITQYDVGEAVSLSPITKGVSNTNYRLQTTSGTYVLTLFEERTDPSSLPFIFGFTAHLSSHGIPTANPVANRAGGLTTLIGDKHAAIIPFFAGTDYSRDALTPIHCHNFGSLLATMHNASGTYTQTRPNPMNPDVWESLLNATNDPTLKPRKILADFKALDTSNLPRGAIHADLCQDNILFDDNAHITGIIDFYFAATDTFLYDLTIAVNSWCFDSKNTLHPARLSALINAYTALRPLTDAERTAWPLMRRAAALRMYATRQYDWHFTPDGADVIKHDPAEYLIKMEISCDLP